MIALDPARMLFEVFDRDLDYTSKNIRNKVFSIYRDMPWTPEQRKVLEPAIRAELEDLVWRLLADFTNVGGILPDEAPGYLICSMEDGSDIGDEYTDYSDMWLNYLQDKREEVGQAE
jgi:hypothetical protein